MTNKEWFLAKVNKMSDEELAGLIAENNPTCYDDYGWQDRYVNPYNRKYEEPKYSGFGGFYEEKEKFYTDYSTAIDEIAKWLKEDKNADEK